jgi:hypothetical protein
MYGDESGTSDEATTASDDQADTSTADAPPSIEERVQKLLEWIEQTRRECPSERFQRRPCTRCQALREVARRLEG